MKTKKLLLTTVATLGLAAGTMAQNVPAYVPTNGLVGWWPFNGNANDESGNGNNGTVNGATLTSDRFGNNAQAYVFDGIDDRVEVAHNQNLNCSSVSISVWFNTNNFLASNGFAPHLLSKRETSGWGNSFQMGVGPYQAQNACWADWSISGNGGIYYNNSTILNTGNWFNLVYTHDGTNVKLFLNGALVKTIVSPGLLTFNTLPLWFGARPNAGNNSSWFNGKLDDIGIWNRALTQQEISDLYNAVNCSNNLTITPQTNLLQTGSTANFNATTSDPNPTYVWQSDFGQGFQTLNNYGKYSGVNTNALSISNVQLSEHNQPVRAISTSGNCVDTSNVAIISISDTCINTVNDTNFITVTDTLLINALITSVTPSINNLIKVYPNPAISHLYIDNGNYQAMSGYSIRIDNSLGQQVFQSAINQQQFYVDLSTWSGNGLYFMHLINPQGQSIDIRKIVLQ
jgi:hypothetical protein